MNYYISDLHFGHKDVLSFDHRPFSDVYQMEEVITMYWNSTVRKEDTVYIIGDFCWGKEDEWLRILNRLEGQKVLIQGNHDLRAPSAKLKAMFADIKPYKEIVDNNRKVLMCHYPMLFYKHSNSPDYFMLCGHVHATKENDYLEHFIKQMRENSLVSEGLPFKNCAQIYNVGAMMPWINYVPRTLDEIIRRRADYESKLINSKVI